MGRKSKAKKARIDQASGVKYSKHPPKPFGIPSGPEGQWHSPPPDNLYIADERVLDFVESSPIRSSDAGKFEDIAISVLTEIAPQDLGHFFRWSVHLPNRKWSIVGNATRTPLDEGICLEAIVPFPPSDSRRVEDSVVFRESKMVHESGRTIEESPHLRLIINLFLYIDAFPESVRNGPPPMAMTDAGDRDRSRSIGLSEPLKEVYSRGPVTPHMRRGHFRFLQAERYTGKRWQTVYVKPTMVKGKAKHVVEPETNDDHH